LKRALQEVGWRCGGPGPGAGAAIDPGVELVHRAAAAPINSGRGETNKLCAGGLTASIATNQVLGPNQQARFTDLATGFAIERRGPSSTSLPTRRRHRPLAGAPVHTSAITWLGLLQGAIAVEIRCPARSAAMPQLRPGRRSHAHRCRLGPGLGAWALHRCSKPSRVPPSGTMALRRSLRCAPAGSIRCRRLEGPGGALIRWGLGRQAASAKASFSALSRVSR